MIPAAFVFFYLAIVLYIGIFAFRGRRGSGAEDFFLASRSLGGFVFLFSLFGTHMTAFAILGSSGHAFRNGIVTFPLMASSSAIVVPVCLLFLGTRIWALGKRYGFMTPVQIFRDRWECGHIGTVIFVVQAALLVPYVIIGVMGGGAAMRAVSGGFVPYWLGGAVVAIVVMSYVFFGGMRGTAWVNTFQTLLFLSFGAVAIVIIGSGMGGFSGAIERLLADPATAPLLTRERISPEYFFSYTFIPLSAIAFPHIGIFCLTARRMSEFRRTVVLYPLCLLIIWLPCVFLGVLANAVPEIPKNTRDDVLLLLLNQYAPVWLSGMLGAGIMAAVMASDSQILALSTMFTEDVFAYYGHKKRFRRIGAGSHGAPVCDRADDRRLRHRDAGAGEYFRSRVAVRILRLRRAISAAGCGALLARFDEVGRVGRDAVGGLRGDRCRDVSSGFSATWHLLRLPDAHTGGHDDFRISACGPDDACLVPADLVGFSSHAQARAGHGGSLLRPRRVRGTMAA